MKFKWDEFRSDIYAEDGEIEGASMVTATDRTCLHMFTDNSSTATGDLPPLKYYSKFGSTTCTCVGTELARLLSV